MDKNFCLALFSDIFEPVRRLLNIAEHYVLKHSREFVFIRDFKKWRSHLINSKYIYKQKKSGAYLLPLHWAPGIEWITESPRVVF